MKTADIPLTEPEIDAMIALLNFAVGDAKAQKARVYRAVLNKLQYAVPMER